MASPIHPSFCTHHPILLILGSHFHPRRRMWHSWSPRPRYRRRVDEIGTLIKLLLGAVEQPRLAASERVSDRTAYTTIDHRLPSSPPPAPRLTMDINLKRKSWTKSVILSLRLNSRWGWFLVRWMQCWIKRLTITIEF